MKLFFTFFLLLILSKSCIEVESIKAAAAAASVASMCLCVSVIAAQSDMSRKWLMYMGATQAKYRGVSNW